MAVRLINPSNFSFGTAVIAIRWPYVLAGATPSEYGRPVIVDETLAPTDFDHIQPGDIVGIGIHTLNAYRGYTVGKAARERGAWVIFGGIHASLFPDEAFHYGGAHSVVTGDGDLVWTRVLDDCRRGEPQRMYAGGRVDPDHLASARWSLMPADRYLWGAVQTVRGCPKFCSFCSVWRTDGQRPRLIPIQTVIQEILQLRRVGFRFILLSDDNFYPATFHDLALAKRNGHAARFEQLKAIRQERFELMDCLAQLPSDMMFLTQITMEAAEDPEFLRAMRRANINGVLVGIESITAEGLRSIYKGFNSSGEDLVGRLRTFAEHRIHVLGSFIFGLPTDTPDIFEATADLAHRADLAAAQFVKLTPFPGTVDFDKWEKLVEGEMLDGVPMNRYWLAPVRRTRLAVPSSALSVDEITAGTTRAWNHFYTLPRIWDRSRRATKLRERLAFVFISKLYRHMYLKTGFASDNARVRQASHWVRLMTRPCHSLFKARPTEDLNIPAWVEEVARKAQRVQAARADRGTNWDM